MSLNDTEKSDLTSQQYRVLEALLLGATLEDAAEQAGVTKRTAVRWSHQEG